MRIALLLFIQGSSLHSSVLHIAVLLSLCALIFRLPPGFVFFALSHKGSGIPPPTAQHGTVLFQTLSSKGHRPRSELFNNRRIGGAGVRAHGQADARLLQ